MHSGRLRRFALEICTVWLVRCFLVPSFFLVRITIRRSRASGERSIVSEQGKNASPGRGCFPAVAWNKKSTSPIRVSRERRRNEELFQCRNSSERLSLDRGNRRSSDRREAKNAAGCFYSAESTRPRPKNPTREKKKTSRSEIRVAGNSTPRPAGFREDHAQGVPGHSGRDKELGLILPHCREGRVGEHPPGSRRRRLPRTRLFLSRSPTLSLPSRERERSAVEQAQAHTSSRSR